MLFAKETVVVQQSHAQGILLTLPILQVKKTHRGFCKATMEITQTYHYRGNIDHAYTGKRKRHQHSLIIQI